MDLATLLVLAVALTTGLAVAGLAILVTRTSGPAGVSGKRVAAVARATARAGGKGADSEAVGNKRRKQLQETLKEIERKQTNPRPTLAVMLQQADWSMHPRRFMLMTGILGLMSFLLFLGMGYQLMVSLGVGVVMGFGFPRWYLSRSINKRKKAFLREFTNAIDVIVRGVKSGLPLNDCLKVIASEASDPVGPEFRNIVEGLKVGVTLEDGLRRMYDRMPLPEVNFFQIVLTIQQKTGGNLSEALSNLSGVLRDRKRLQGKIQALSSEAKASAMIIGSLPIIVAFVVYLTTPDYIALLFTERFGNFLLMCCVIWMSVGIFVMRKMINFKF